MATSTRKRHELTNLVADRRLYPLAGRGRGGAVDGDYGWDKKITEI